MKKVLILLIGIILLCGCDSSKKEEITINKVTCEEKDKLVKDGFSMLPNWKDAIDRYMVELRKEDK